MGKIFELPIRPLIYSKKHLRIQKVCGFSAGMPERLPEMHYSYLGKILRKTCKDIEAIEIISDIVGGVAISILAVRYGLANQSELRELIFLAIGGAVFPFVVIFLIRLIFITPYKLLKELEQKNVGLEEKLKTQDSLVIHSASYHKRDKSIDVTDVVKSRLQDGKLEVASDNNLGGDPLKDTRKILTIDYSVAGKRLKRDFREGEIARLP